VTTEQSEKLFNTFNAYENGVGSDEILSAMAIDNIGKNSEIVKEFCDGIFLDDICNAGNLIIFAKKKKVECDEEEITKEFYEMFSSKTAKIDDFTLKVFGVQAIDMKLQSTKGFGAVFKQKPFVTPQNNIVINDDNSKLNNRYLSYLQISHNDLKFDEHIMVDDDIQAMLEEQEKKGYRTVFEKMRTSEELASETISNQNLCQRICCCF